VVIEQCPRCAADNTKHDCAYYVPVEYFATKLTAFERIGYIWHQRTAYYVACFRGEFS
jgi:hypothetical protein